MKSLALFSFFCAILCVCAFFWYWITFRDAPIRALVFAAGFYFWGTACLKADADDQLREHKK